MADATMSRRPKYLNLVKIRLPMPGFVSILHRVSGALLIFSLPLVTWALDAALASEAGHAQVASVLAHPLAKLVALGAIWSLMHHLCAGVRFLLLEAHIGVELPAARRGALLVLVVSVLLTLAVGAAVLL